MTTSYRLKNIEQKNKMEEEVPFYFNGEKLFGYKNEPIAAALLANGIKSIRTCEVSGEPRGVFCGIGHCYECRAEVDGVSNVRTCLTQLKAGIKVFSAPSWQIGVE